MTDTASSPAAVPFKDTSTSLIVFGVLEIILGAICALMVLLMVFAQLMASRIQNASGQLPVQQLVIGAVIYLLLAIFFVTMGYGSIRARRWARALMLVWAWLWLVFGVMGMGYVCFVMPDIFAIAAKQQAKTASPEAMAVIRMIAIATMSVVYVILPGILVLYYSSRNVKATCEWKDPKPRWTDRCPLPVLGISLLLGFGAAASPLAILVYHAFPFFGILLSGPAAVAFALISAVLWGFVAWSLYKVRLVGWWSTIVLLVVYLTSGIITFLRIDLFEMYRQMGVPDQSIQLLKNCNYLSSKNMIVMMVASSLVYFGYMLFIKKYFQKALPHDSQV